jgi:hypothetical protein
MTDADLHAINDAVRRAGRHQTRPIRFLRPERIAGCERYLAHHVNTDL